MTRMCPECFATIVDDDQVRCHNCRAKLGEVSPPSFLYY